MERLESEREPQQTINVYGKSISLREQADNVLKLVVWSDEVVKQALSAQPYAALAWSGVSILLPVRPRFAALGLE